ncbi:serine hydrolase domain-containing protein [Paraferrimonas sedimenticola]|uniref:6-aminohexanoate-dimer hydrolase n=1 Tax=Paraferrimonas sedimenticola TaxID=375674 RepID=A0AA37RV36_9GAMM|nr:serine hydrolase [Paraferrimonas sedimenticola]GLP95357.1 6-aminohexanoate-dimer hydrolase [Paraferrimonas sedimenticola]
MKRTLISLTLASLMTMSVAHATPAEGKSRAEMGVDEYTLLAPDQNRYSFKNLQEFTKSKSIDAGTRAPLMFEYATVPSIENMEFTHKGQKMQLQDMLAKHRADAFIVLKDGKIVHEQYFDGQTDRTHHLMMSVTKSFTGILGASLIAEGKLKRDALVSEYVTELKGTPYGDATVGQVLDMVNNVNYSEEYEDPNADVFKHMKTVGFMPMEHDYQGPKTVRDFVSKLDSDGPRPHGEEFHYISANTDVVAWILEKASGMPYEKLFQERIWSKLGNERDAFIVVDTVGVPVASGGLNATARDLARFGQMLADQGKNLAGEQILPAAAIKDVEAGGDIQAFYKGGYGVPGKAFEGWSYKNQFWHTSNENKAYTALGIFGQWIYVDPTENVVVVRQASSPAAVTDEWDAEFLSAIDAMIKKLK